MANRSRQRLSDYFVGRLKPGPQDIKVWDADLPGFGVRVTPSGVKSWIVQFDRNGKKINATLGRVAAMNEKTARKKAEELRDLHNDGVDILAHLKKKKSASDIRDVNKVWEENYAKLLKPSSQKSYRSIIKNHILPGLGSRLVKDLALDDVRKFHAGLEKETPIQANRAVAILSKFIRIAEKEGLRNSLLANPCLQFERPTEKTKERIFSIQELARLEKALSDLVTEKALDGSIADLVRFIAFSGLRSGEALDLTWDAVDEDHNLMRFDSHKTDAGGTRPKLLPLNTHLKMILHHRSQIKIGDHVFPSAVTGEKFQGFGKCWNRIRDKAKLKPVRDEIATSHDLRRTFRSHCGELGYPDSVGDTLLGHSLGKVKETYIQYAADGILGQASQAVADWINEAMKGGNPKVGERIKPPAARKSRLPRKAKDSTRK